jgi:hypothetical protein
MNSSLDLNLLLMARQGNGEQSELPDLYAVTPPHRTARGRESDSLIIYLSMGGNSPLTTEAQTQLLEQLAHKFYKTTGSLTAALRTVAEALNLYLLDRNLRSTSVGRQGIGQLLLVALRTDTLYLVQCGAVHAFLVTRNETQHLYDLQSSGRGLGLSRTMPVRFLQIKMAADDYLVLATVSAPGWSEATLKHPDGQGIEALRRQLLENAGQEYNTVIIQAQAGTGKLRLLRRKPESPAMVPQVTVDQSTETASHMTLPAAEADSGPTEDRRLGIPPVSVPASITIEQPAEDKGLGVSSSSTVPTPSGIGETSQPRGEQPQTAPISTQVVSQQPAAVEAEIPQAGIPLPEPIRPTESPSRPIQPPGSPQKFRPISPPRPYTKFFASFRSTLASIGKAILLALRSAMGTIGSALLRLLKNLLPDADVLRLPPSTMVFIAIAIPLILAVIGGMVFLQRGRAQQHQIYYQQAVEKAVYAATLTNPLEQRLALQTAIGDLDKAENYTLTSQSQELRAQVVANLDTLDSVKRLDYKQAIVGGLDSGVNVTRIVATTTDLYLLNEKEGNVLRAIITGRGYEIDPNFQCGPTYGPINVGPLVDIAELPPGSYENASVLGIDSNGNLLFCVVDSQPYSASLAPPNTGLGEPSAMSLDRGDLFVLDPKVNAVWIYRNMEVSQQPRLFFGDTIPPMQDTIDLAVYNNDLFLLHADGHITKCTYSGMTESPTRCDDPYPYSDNRPGRVHGPVIEDAVFNQIYFSSFPERSIFLLDPKSQAVYYFSVLLTLQWQYQPKSPLADGKASAFAISPNRIAFLAIANNVYYAAMP